MNIKKGYNIPDCLELKKSSIHGLGIFATKFIPKGSNLGICHYYDFSKVPLKKYLRNTLVPFFNYSKNKNAHLPIVKKDFEHGTGYVTELIILKDIQKEEEILLPAYINGSRECLVRVASDNISPQLLLNSCIDPS